MNTIYIYHITNQKKKKNMENNTPPNINKKEDKIKKKKLKHIAQHYIKNIASYIIQTRNIIYNKKQILNLSSKINN